MITSADLGDDDLTGFVRTVLGCLFNQLLSRSFCFFQFLLILFACLLIVPFHTMIEAHIGLTTWTGHLGLF
jgi:hypothetical protein